MDTKPGLNADKRRVIFADHIPKYGNSSNPILMTRSLTRLLISSHFEVSFSKMVSSPSGNKLCESAFSLAPSKNALVSPVSNPSDSISLWSRSGFSNNR
jgi:hypothetical protein